MGSYGFVLLVPYFKVILQLNKMSIWGIHLESIILGEKALIACVNGITPLVSRYPHDRH